MEMRCAVHHGSKDMTKEDGRPSTYLLNTGDVFTNDILSDDVPTGGFLTSDVLTRVGRSAFSSRLPAVFIDHERSDVCASAAELTLSIREE